MSKQLLMGNEAIALGAIRAGVSLVCGYPGTPSTEILETIAKQNPGNIYVEWSVNEKSAMEVACGASYTGARAMVTMKQVGLNVASDPLMSLAYIGIKGGLVVVVADDPGPISSQTEQDTRHFGIFSKLPVFDPSSAQEAYEMIYDAFDYSEKYNTPVLFRPTTRICHGCADISLYDERKEINVEGFIKNSKWVIFPKLAYANHIKMEARNSVIAEDFSTYRFNESVGFGKKGIATGGVSYAYTKEALKNQNANYKLLKIATPHPFPKKLALEFLNGLDEVLVIEELDPIIERELLIICGQNNLNVKIKGKLTNHVSCAGENSVESVKSASYTFLNIKLDKQANPQLPNLPVRPPVLCAGCPHRASFYAVKQAMKGKKAVFSGDIGCYTLGNARPLDMVDTCLCMGAGITVAQGLHRIEPDTINFAFVGDSTFFHTGISGVVNAVYNEADIVLIVLDNSTTAMTGHQPHPGTGKTMMGNISQKINIAKVLEALGVKSIQKANPLHLKESIDAVLTASAFKGISAVIFESPCIAIIKPNNAFEIDIQKCTKCKRCIKEIGCPAIVLDDNNIKIEKSICFGCSLCSQVCPFDAIGGAKND
jgi:indolepyruvate ferredoxin oxidoreductase alpha subunit